MMLVVEGCRGRKVDVAAMNRAVGRTEVAAGKVEHIDLECIGLAPIAGRVDEADSLPGIVVADLSQMGN